MTDFESWSKLRWIDFRIRFSPPKQFEAYIEQEREDSWEAALKCVKSKIDYANAGNDMIGWIFEEELEDAQTQERPRSGLNFSS